MRGPSSGRAPEQVAAGKRRLEQRAATSPRSDNPPVVTRMRDVPWGVALFLVYAFAILALIGLSLRYVIDLAINAPVSFPGLVVMILLAYTIFTITLVLQRKEAARGFAMGLSSLTVPIVPWAFLVGAPVVAVFFGVLAILLFRGLATARSRAWLAEP